jgi:glutaredoxin 3
MGSAFDVEHIAPGTTLELYVSPTCPYCRAAREHYDRVGTPYTAHDAANNPDLRRKMLELTGGDPTVPAIVVNGKYVQSGWGSPPHG